MIGNHRKDSCVIHNQHGMDPASMCQCVSVCVSACQCVSVCVSVCQCVSVCVSVCVFDKRKDVSIYR